MDSSVAHYAAFICYSSVDADDAMRLHRNLETYKVPKGLVGTNGFHGPIPKRIAPVFRDRDELASSDDLGGTINDALERSRHLVVLCSPNAKASRWVNKEIVTFKRFSGDRPVSCLVVGREPNGDKAGVAEYCFPPALNSVEPLAADARKVGDGRRKATLKIIAAVLGVQFDQLWRREQRRTRIRVAWVSVALLLAVLFISRVFIELRAASLATVNAQIGDLIGLARARLTAGYADESILFSLRAIPRDVKNHPASDSAQLLLRTALQSNHKLRQFNIGSAVTHTVVDTNASQLFTASSAHGTVWNVSNGKQRFSFDGPGSITAAAFDSTGKKLAVAFEAEASKRSCVTCSRTVEVWDTTKGGRVGRFSTFGVVVKVSFSRDGRELVTASQGGAEVWSGDRYERKELLAHVASSALIFPVFDASFDQNASSIVTAGGDNMAVRWDRIKRDKFGFPHDSPVMNIVLGPDGKTVLTVTRSGLATIWPSGNEAKKIELKASDDSPIISAHFEGQSAVVTVSQNAINMWNITDEARLDWSIKLGKSTALAAVSNDSKMAVVAFADGMAEVWALDSVSEYRKRLFSLRHGDLITSVAFSNDGKKLVTASNDGTAVVWSITSPYEPERFHTKNRTIGLSTVGGRQIAVVWNHGDAIEVWDLQTKHLVSRFPYEPVYDSCRATISESVTRMLTVCHSSSVAVWDLKSERIITEFADFGSRVLAAACTDANCNQIVTSTAGGRIEIWDVSKKKRVRQYNALGSVYNAWFSKDGRKLLLQKRRQQQLTLWDTQTGEAVPLNGAYNGSLAAASFDSRGKVLATALSNEKLQIWDTSNGNLVEEVRFVGGSRVADPTISAYGANNLMRAKPGEFIVLENPSWRDSQKSNARIRALRFSQNGEQIATMSEDDKVAIWDRKSGNLLDDFEYENDPNMIEFGAQGDFLLIALSRSIAKHPFPQGSALAALAIRSLPLGRNCITLDDYRHFVIARPAIPTFLGESC